MSDVSAPAPDAGSAPDAVPAVPVADNPETAAVVAADVPVPDAQPDNRCYIVYVDAEGMHRVLRDEYDAAAH